MRRQLGMRFCWRFLLLFLSCSSVSLRALAGGSGLNVVVVANQASSNSLELANYYCLKRHIPPQNLLYLNWTGGNIDWARSNVDNLIVAPLASMIASRQLSNQVDYVVLCMDIPFLTTKGTKGTKKNCSRAWCPWCPLW